MIEDIEITNFRCFDRLKVSGFKRINLISGKNNAGKTALLEAILLNSTPTKSTVLLLGKLRRQPDSYRRILPDKMWDDLFFQQDVSSICSIKSIVDGIPKIVKISIDINYEELLVDDDRSRKYQDNSYYDKVTEEQFESSTNPCVLLIEVQVDNRESELIRIISIRESFQTRIMSSVSRQQNSDRDVNSLDRIQNSSFFPSSLKSSNVSLTREFDRARLNEKEDEVLKAFQIVDNSITTVESFSVPEPTIYLKRSGEKRLPLSLFGDAMNRIADISLKIINGKNSILLIDEIENGIHHSTQVAFWDFLYKLAEQLNVQIFATTHSLEMTEAFIKAGLDRQDSAAHFELVRHEKTNKIVAINRDLETLEYGISHHKEVRGGA